MNVSEKSANKMVQNPEKERSLTTLNHINEGMFDLVNEYDLIECCSYLSNQVEFWRQKHEALTNEILGIAFKNKG